jgi:branched-chain amino acid transport system substrate-binding protein
MKGKGLLTILLSFCLLLTLVPLLLSALTKPATAQEETLKIGLIGPLTGPGAAFGTNSIRAAEMAMEEVNKKGVKVKGVTYKFKIILEDDKYFAAIAVDRLRKLIDRDKVKIVIGSLGSASSAAEAPICAANKILHLTDSFDKNIIAANNTYSFMAGIMPDFQAPGFIKLLAQRHPNIQKFAILYINDATGTAGRQRYEPLIKEKNWELITEGYERGIIEFGPVCAKIISAKPDLVLFCSVPPGDAHKVIKGLRELGYKGILAHVGGMMMPELYKLIGEEIGVVYGCEGIGEKPYANDEYVMFYSKYIGKYGREAWLSLGLVFYSWVKIYAQAMEEAQSIDSTVIRDLLATPGKEWYCVTGGKCYCINDEIANKLGFGSNRYFNYVWQGSTWDNVAKKQVNVDWVYPYGWPGGKIPK